MSLKNRKILIVEDEFFIADDLAKALAAASAQVVGPVYTVKQALDLINGPPPIDGAVIDINLRGEPAFKIADALAARKIPYVFVTGYDAAMVSPEYGNVVLLEKPADPHHIIEQMTLLLSDGQA